MTVARRLGGSLLLAAAMMAPAGGRAAGGSALAEPRLGLVIAEAGYPQAAPATAAADAGLMATALAQAGFDVTALADASATTLRRTVATFAAKVRAAGPGATVAVYVSGDGLQYDGENWLVPVDARIDRGEEIPKVAVKLSDLATPLEAVPARTRLFLFDIARETPFAREGATPASGLALVDAPVGSIYAFNTAPGAVAPSEVPPYGAYARALAEAMQEPGLTLGRLLQRVRLRVGERTNGAAVPFDDGAADSPFAFVPGPPAAVAARPAIASLPPSAAYSAAVAQDTLPGYVDFLSAYPRDPLSPRVRAMAALRREAQVWSEAVRDNTPRAYWTYMRRYPRGPHFLDVRRKLFDLHAALEPPPRFDVAAFEGLPAPPAGDAAILEHPFPNFSDPDGPPIPAPPQAMLSLPSAAFFETLPPPPPAPPGALPLPLPVDRPTGASSPFGSIAQPDVSSGPLVTTLAKGRDGTALVTSKPDGAVVSRVFATDARATRTIEERTAGGRPITTATIAGGEDGSRTITLAGPTNAVIDRSVSRDGAQGGGRVTTLFDASEAPLATTVVSPDGIVLSQSLVPGKVAQRPLVAIFHPDANGNLVVSLEPGAEIVLPPPTAVPQSGGADVSPADVALPAPALPVTAGLTGQAPALNLPPAPATPAFDAAAAPVSAPVPTEIAPTAVSKAPAAGQAALAPPAGTPSVPAAMAAPAPSGSSVLPISPPLPPPRSTAGSRKRAGH